MTTDRSYLSGGFRNVSDAMIAADEPASAPVLALLAQNAHLISDTIRPRHLVNQYFPRDGSDQALVVALAAGARFGIWGPFTHEPGTELQIKIFAADTDTYSSDNELYVFALPELPDADTTTSDLLDEAVEYWSADVTSTSGEWVTDTLDHSEIASSGSFYLLGWVHPSDDTASECDLSIVSIRERRR